MKKYLVIFAAAAAMLCGCNKYDDQIADLEKRVNNAEQTVSGLVSKVDALQQLMDKLNAGVSITSVAPAAGGFTVSFSDNTSFTVVNGADGADGADGAQGPAGKDSEVKYTEDSLCYYFDFGDGNVVSVAKAGAFGIKVEKDAIEVENGVPATLPFEVVGADETTKLLVEDCAYEVEIGEDALTISAAKVVDGNFVFKAVRNSDGANSAVVISVSKKAPQANVTIALEVTEITQTGALVLCTPSNETAHYIISVEKASYVDQFSSDEELVQADLDYYCEYYASDYADYGFSSIEDLVYNGLGHAGYYEDDWAGYLQAATDYVAYAFAIDEDLNLLSPEVTKVPFSTLEEEALDATYLGVAIWHDAFVSTVFDMEGENLDLPVDVYEDNYMPGCFYFDSPYNYANIAAWFGLTPEEMEQYTGNWKKAVISIDASNPSKVYMPYQELGCSLNSQYGWMSGGATYQGETLSTGVYANDQIVFDGLMYVGLQKYNGGTPLAWVNEEGGSFVIDMPAKSAAPAKAPATRSAASYYKIINTLGFCPRANFEISK